MQDYREKLSTLEKQLRVYRAGKIDNVTRISWEIDFRNILQKAIENSQEGKRILDVGCGPGSYLIALSERNRECCGVDPLKETSLVKANKKAKQEKATVLLCQATGEYLPFQNEIFDMVLCLSTLQHVSDQKKTLREIRRVLKDDKYLLTSIPTTKNIHTMFRRYIPESFTVAYTTGEIRELLSEAKFNMVDMKGSGFFPPLLTKILNFLYPAFGEQTTRQILKRLNNVANSWYASAGNIIVLSRKS